MLKQSRRIYLGVMILFGWLVFSATPAFATLAPLQATFTLEKNNRDKTFSATITLKNNSNSAIQAWKLAFTSSKFIVNIDEGHLTEQVGGYHVIAPNDLATMIPAHGVFVFHIKGRAHITHETETPSGYFLIVTNATTHAESVLPIQSNILLPAAKSDLHQDEYARTQEKNKASIEDNAVLPKINLNESLIIPLPADLKRTSGMFTLKSNTVVAIDSSLSAASAAAQFFVNTIAPSTGFHLSIVKTKTDKAAENAIVFTQKNADKMLGKEGYTLQISTHHITITANTETGFFYAVQSLRQLLPPAIFDKKLATQITWKMPCVTILDYPRFGYRGLSLDVSRHFITIEQVKRLLDLMALHKLNQFQWHLSDDEGWRIEIKKYPELTSIGAWRGFGRTLPPAYGSGAKRYGGYYSQAEIHDVVKYANERHITIIPEIDMPGHARAMIHSLPTLLIDAQDKSQYTSVQGYHDNVLSPCLDNTYTVIDNIVTEVSQLFPAQTIHVGSDEVPADVWLKSPACQSLMASQGLKTVNELQNYFLKRIQHIIQSKNKNMAGWEEVIEGGDLDKSTVVYSWKNVDSGVKAAERGYPVVLMPAQYLYFDLAYSADAKEPGQVWAGFVDTFKAYSYQPIQSTWAKNIVDQVVGIQGALWAENINSNERLDYFAFPKMLALAEVAWTPKARRNWINFSERVGQLHLSRLDHYGVQYRISPPGIDLSQLAASMLKANVEFPGLQLRFSLNNTIPSPNSLLYVEPIQVIGAVNMRAFNGMQRGSRIISPSV
jgi:hexosaminidase